MITLQGENTHYSYVKRLTALFMITKGTMKANISANAACMAIKELICLKSINRNAKGC